MGCDGGTIPKRDELVRTKKKPEEKDKSSMQLFRWRNCHLTQEALQTPIVACGLGILYNKESVLQYLVNKTPFPEASAHIRTLKDVKTLKFTKNPAFKGQAQNVGGYIDDKCSPYICPIIGLEMNDRNRFCFSWKCGCVVSERGFQLGADNKCINCMTQYEPIDVVVLNPTEDEIPIMKINIAKRKEVLISKKNAKKVVKEEPVNEEPIKEEPVNEEPVDDFEGYPLNIRIDANNKIKIECKKEENDDKTVNTMTKTKRPITSAAGSSSSISSTNCRKLEDPVYKKAKLTHSIAKDQTATNVYKSLFTSHEDDRTQTRAHWITYNPFYN